jgi:peptidoglycan L-alanyl-D-glutamate endopeptidase CwlK
VTYILGARSEKALIGVHPDLIRIVRRAIQITPLDFSVTEGVRTISRQKELFAAGASRTMNSRHLTGHAVDLAPLVDGRIRWDWPLFYRLSESMSEAAKELAIPLEWGGNWTRGFKDGPHWQLPWKDYPA